MTTQNNELISSYILWLKKGFEIKDVEGYQEITTPFLDSKNDHLQIYVSQANDDFCLSDGGYIINDLEMSGVDISTEHRHRILTQVVNGFGVRLRGEELYVEASQTNFPQKKHLLLQAMLAVSDMFMTSFAKVQGLFAEDVALFMQKNEVRFSPGVTLQGKQLPHPIDFIIPPSSRMPERLIKAVNNPTSNHIKAIMWSWMDLKETRSNSSMYAFLNDTDRGISGKLITTIQENDIKPLLWSRRKKYIEELSA